MAAGMTIADRSQGASMGHVAKFRCLAVFLVTSGMSPAVADDLSEARAYLSTLQVMVTMEEQDELPAAAAKLLVAHVNNWLSMNDVLLVDASTVEKIKTTQRKNWEQSTSGGMGYFQWMAQQVNAGLYLELATQVTAQSGTSGSAAQLTIFFNVRDPATADLLASLPFENRRITSSVGVDDAVRRSIPVAVAEGLPDAWAQISKKLEKSLSVGIEYQVVLQNTFDADAVEELRKKLATRSKSVLVSSSSEEQTVWRVRALASGGALAGTIRTLAKTIPGLEGFRQVLLENSGKKITMDTGAKAP